MINQTNEFNKSIPNILCDDIIEQFLLEKNINNNFNKNFYIKNENDFIKQNDTINNFFDFKQFEIPKNCLKWNKIENILYKQLLINLKKYKDEILLFINSIKYNDRNYDYNELNVLLNKKIYLKSYYIQEYKAKHSNIFITDYNKINNRYNIITFIYFLNDYDDDDCKIIISNHFSNSDDKNIPVGEKERLSVPSENESVIIKPKKGKLVLFSENMNYQYKYELSKNTIYLITGQLYY